MWRWKKGPRDAMELKNNGESCHEPRMQVARRSWGEQGNGFSLRAYRKEESPNNNLILIQWDSHWTSDQKNCKKINLCSFKPLSLCYFLTAAVENKYTLLCSHWCPWYSPNLNNWLLFLSKFFTSSSFIHLINIHEATIMCQAWSTKIAALSEAGMVITSMKLRE